MQNLAYTATIIILACLCSCTKDENKKIKFGWAKAGNRLYYDYYTPTDTIRDSRRIIIHERFQEDILNTSTSTNNILYFRILDHDIVVKKGGLYGRAVENCGWGIINSSKTFDFLYAPNAPRLNQELVEYGCGRSIVTKNNIITIDTTIVVPKGTFKTYVMRHENGDKSYWNADEGLIMYDRYLSGRFQGSLKLTRIQTY
ncbi:hypothetical protein [Hymenobacter weizhouensis]|uniref:hypothetical protein n=1 Tax=Hymenobacter sp. YIM 151500-1 TaxID=2987689 RepID=UPI002225E3A5|nr:hypothetical protein [Hymenobacter sp. YIM 151500-1]UYZ63564.1 hypothetical protein OIS53_01675 [Hymenobacter sp. YIM 151500-1]